MLTDFDYELLSAYIDGALTTSERAALEKRLQTEPELSRELDELRATVTLLNNLPVLKAPRDLTLDVRYARRTSVFYTSAAFSALSTVAAIVVFALGVYLFWGNKAPLPAATSSQANQVAVLPTLADITVDKAAAATATEVLMFSEMEPSATLLPDMSADSGLAAVGSAEQESTTEPLPPLVEAQESPFQLGVPQPTTLPEDAIAAGSVAPAPESPTSENHQGRTPPATATVANAPQFAAPSANTASGGLVPATAGVADANAVPLFATGISQTEVVEAYATALPAATLMPSTATAQPTNTLTATPLPTETATQTTTPQPTAVVRQADETPQPDIVPLLLMGLGLALFIIAIGTTIARRRSRS